MRTPGSARWTQSRTYHQFMKATLSLLTVRFSTSMKSKILGAVTKKICTKRGSPMKSKCLRLFLLALLSLPLVVFAQEDAEKAAKDTAKVTEKETKKAAKETKDAGQKAGNATADAAQNAGNKVKKGTKDAAKATEKGAQKVEEAPK
jgi:hypothetical protein